MIDGHIHLENGPLTLDYLNKFVEEAIKNNIDCIQILDHTHRFHEFYSIYDNVRNASKIQEEWLSTKTKDSIVEYLKLIELLNHKIIQSKLNLVWKYVIQVKKKKKSDRY